MSRQEHIEIDGSCHCGNIRFVLRWPGVDKEMPVRKCGCTFCQKHAGAWTSHRNATLTVNIVTPSMVKQYRFGTKTADFYVCSTCGVVPFVLSEIDATTYAVVNVHSLHDSDCPMFSESVTNFDGENQDARLNRRQQNWIPNVIIEENS